MVRPPLRWAAMHSIRTVASLISALVILQVALGLLSVQLPLRMAAYGFSAAEIGLVSAAYSGGFMAGAWVGPAALARVGHIRLFAAAAAIASATILAFHWAGGLGGAIPNRFAAGVGVALAFAAAESWMNSAIGRGERGSVIGFYMVCTKAALALGPFLGAGAPAGAAEPLMIAAMLLSVALVPMCATSQAQPEAPKAQPLALAAQFATAPAAVIACFGAGLINTGVLTLAPLYADQRFGPGAAAGFQAAAWTGSLLLQWPAGRLSDRIDRRLVIAALVGLAALSALGLALLGGGLGFGAAALLFALWGAGGLSFYGVAVAHMADRAEPGAMARATSGLLFVWALGAVLGPLVAGPLADAFGVGVVFWISAIGGLGLAGAMFWRPAEGEGAAPAKAPFSNKPATSVAAAELAYGQAPTAADPGPAAGRTKPEP